MDLKRISSEKKSKPSFWNRLLRLPRKSQFKEKDDDSFKRQSMIYSSMSTLKNVNQENNTFEESENFVTLESSALEGVHKDAGILFLNKSSLENCFVPREDNKHVQFAPTPMNKYYNVDVRSAPLKKQDENKENAKQIKSVKPARPILRQDKKRKSSVNSSSAEDTDSNSGTKLVNVTYIDGPEVKTPSIPRTSTKIALVNRKNGSIPELNVSSIVKYNSLPRNSTALDKQMHSSDAKSVQSLRNQPSKNTYEGATMEQKYRRSVRSLSSHRQSCYGVSDPSRIFEAKKVLQAQNQIPVNDVQKRLSLGPPIHFSHYDVNHPVENNVQKCHSVQIGPKNFKRFFNASESSKSHGSSRNVIYPDQSKTKPNIPLESNKNKFTRQYYCASTEQIPNMAINEVGLPIVSNTKRRDTTAKSRSKSPHYIPLSETFTSKSTGIGSNFGTSASGKVSCQQSNACEFSEQTTLKTVKANQNTCTGFSNGQPSVISESRRHAILSAMYSQKRKIVNKICKYNSKQSDEGFSSMADDECSFNCSCPSCVTKLSRNYKRSGLRQFFSQNKDKYFFTIEPDIKEGDELERLPENKTFDGPMAVAQLHLVGKPKNESVQNKKWYDCNDTLCQTPSKNDDLKQEKEKEIVKTPTNKMVENIYENITQIINSATKKNLTPQDVKRLLSTPIPSSMKSQKKSQRILFPEDGESAKFNESLKQILSPKETSDCFNDSIVLLQEIFQKLSQECKELLQPNSTSNTSNQTTSTPICEDSPGNKYVNDLVKNLKSSDISEIDFATIIGGIAQNIFNDTKAKKQRVRRTLMQSSTSLPDLQKNAAFLNKAIKVANSLRNLCDSQIDNDQLRKNETIKSTGENSKSSKVDSSTFGEATFSSRQLPEGWSKTPTTENSNLSSDTSAIMKVSSSETDKESSKCSEGELLLLENAIRLGMGLEPIDKVKKTHIASSPSKIHKYKSRDVLSGKGKLKLKIYYNCGLATIYVMKAAKLDWAVGRELNAYVKITMVPDETKRVHWRTNVQKSQKNPVFNQKFSFELLAEDETKRLVFSVWHRDYGKQRSELIGCMSFSVKHVMDNAHNVDGWYRLLRERFGTQKHFAAHTRKKSCS